MSQILSLRLYNCQSQGKNIHAGRGREKGGEANFAYFHRCEAKVAYCHQYEANVAYVHQYEAKVAYLH